RDLTVTGVQTCALPIWGRHFQPTLGDCCELVEKVRSINSSLQGWAESAAPLTREIKMASEDIRQQNEVQAGLVKNLASTTGKIEIGRASCRERGEVAE